MDSKRSFHIINVKKTSFSNRFNFALALLIAEHLKMTQFKKPSAEWQNRLQNEAMHSRRN
jgi:hypothetical protein